MNAINPVIEVMRYFEPERGCPICRTSVGYRSRHKYCAACESADWKCEGCGQSVDVDEMNSHDCEGEPR